MRNFHNDRRSGGGDRGRPQMHSATCGDCGNRCEVPFRPTGERPVYCSDCFRKDDDFGSRKPERSRFERSESRDSGRFGSRDFGRSSFDEKPMYGATCGDCGKRCEVPFRPTGDRPVYCSDCFSGSKEKEFGQKKSEQSPEQFEQLNRKLDKILKTLAEMSQKNVSSAEKFEKKIEEPKESAKPSASKKATVEVPKKAVRLAKAKEAPVVKKTTKVAAPQKTTKATKAKK